MRNPLRYFGNYIDYYGASRYPYSTDTRKPTFRELNEKKLYWKKTIQAVVLKIKTLVRLAVHGLRSRQYRHIERGGSSRSQCRGECLRVRARRPTQQQHRARSPVAARVGRSVRSPSRGRHGGGQAAQLSPLKPDIRCRRYLCPDRRRRSISCLGIYRCGAV
jgi:hypothetical protein